MPNACRMTCLEVWMHHLGHGRRCSISDWGVGFGWDGMWRRKAADEDVGDKRVWVPRFRSLLESDGRAEG